MQRLTVLYDATCGLCCAARRWLERQDLYVPLEFVRCASDQAECRFPTLDHAQSATDVTVVGQGGEIWRGAEAWLMVLWATWSYRGLSLELARPGRIHRGREFVHWISRHRHRIGSALHLPGQPPR